jgi:hypothetical protein
MADLRIISFFLPLLLTLAIKGEAQSSQLDQYNVAWASPSKNSGESMPCGGGDIGLNVWVENGDILFYISRSGTFDENNAFLKLGRVRIRLTPNHFIGSDFKQELVLKHGYVTITGADNGQAVQVNLWVDVFRPVIHIDIKSEKALEAEATYESWRYEDRSSNGKENNANSYKWAKRDVKTFKDEITFQDKGILFFHRNKAETVFDVTVEQQELEKVKAQMFNPLRNLTFGGVVKSQNMEPAGTVNGKYLDTNYKGWKLRSTRKSTSHSLQIYLHNSQTETQEDWYAQLQKTVTDAKANEKNALAKTREWWKQFWNRSFIYIDPKKKEDPSTWQTGRNYQLFRYMLGCNAFGQYPTKFNGGLFTYDPSLTDSTLRFTPDHRNWGGGTMTAQNQRLVYFPLLKSGDVEMMDPQFDFYLRTLRNAELRSETYWGHRGACFTEQLENFGLPNCTEYGWDRPENFDPGLEYNAWLEYQWDTVLEFCLMMLETERYTGKDIREHIPFIESCLTFFDEHYQYLAGKRGRKTLDENGQLILYPGSACETYKMAYNATSTIAALQTVLSRLLELPPAYQTEERQNRWTTMLKRIPPVSFREFNGHKTIAPAKHWERINNTETPQLYPVFPWSVYGIGKPDLDIAINTYQYDTAAIKFRSHTGWKQDNIFAARLGLTNEAAVLTVRKLQDSGRRFPAFWGPGFDWVPDHNWGGSGMIGLQEMLLQVDGQKIFLFPAWPPAWDVHFKLHAPYNTTIECKLLNGKIAYLKVHPEERTKDISNMLEKLSLNAK